MHENLTRTVPPTRTTTKTCGHHRHVGTCPCCQRAQLARWNAQLAQVAQTRQGPRL